MEQSVSETIQKISKKTIMNKIKKYLISLGMRLEYVKSYTAYHCGRVYFGGKTYDADVYIIVGTNYHIHCKRSGRTEYRLYKEYRMVALCPTQIEFCKLLQEIFADNERGKI